MNEIISSITSVLDIHLNIDQNMIINTSAIFFSLEKITSESLSNRLNNTQIRLPSILNNNSIVLLRVSFSNDLFYFKTINHFF